MKKYTLIILSVLIVFGVVAKNKLFISKIDGTLVEKYVSSIDSILFSSDKSGMIVYNANKTTSSYSVSGISSLIFDKTEQVVLITYTNAGVTIDNPYTALGVTVTSNGANVVVNSTITDQKIVYRLTGSTSDGSFKIYSTSDFELQFQNANITNTKGPAVNIQSKRTATLLMLAGTTNYLYDGTVYSTSTEDQKGTVFSEGLIDFVGFGTLNLNSVSKNAICSDDTVMVNGPKIYITSAVKDAIHSKGLLQINKGTIQATASNDCLECEGGRLEINGGNLTLTNAVYDTKCLKCDSSMAITGGTINLTVSGDMAKGIKSGGIMNLSGGNIVINTSGAAITSLSGAGYEVSYCAGIKSDSILNINGANITITSTGVAGKGISADNTINISSGTLSITNSGNGAVYTNTLGVADAYSGAGIETDANINVTGGDITINASGTAAKAITADGNVIIGSNSSTSVIKITNSGSKLLISGTANYTSAVYAEAKGIKCDGNIELISGTYTLKSTQAGTELVDADGSLNISGGTFTVTLDGNQTKAFKSDGLMNLSGGVIGLTISGGVVLQNVTSTTYDPSYCVGFKSASDINISGSNITITHSGAAGKGISTDTNLNMSAGNVTITTSGAGTTYLNSSSVKDSYSAACISTDGNISVLGGKLTASSSGTGGKGLKATGTVTIGSTTSSPTVILTTTGTKFEVSSSTSTSSGPGGSSGTVYDYCHPKAIVCEGAYTMNNGTLTISSSDDAIHSEKSITVNGGTTNIPSSVEGIESLTITFNGGVVTVIGSDDALNATAGTVAGGSESDDGSYIYMNGGVVVCSATSGDAVDSNGKFSMTGGVLVTFGPANATNEDIDVNGSITVNGGLLFGACYNSSMYETIASTAQYGVNLKSSSTLSTTGSYFRIVNSSTGTEIGTFITPRAAYYFHISSPLMAKSTGYSIYTGGSYSGGTTYGSTSGGAYCTGGTYSSGSLKKSFTLGTSYITTTN